MAFNLFKKKEEEKKVPSAKKPEETKKVVQALKSPQAPRAVVKTVSAPAKKEKRKISSFSLSLPHITEKASMLQEQGQYVFKVIPGATKHGVKNSVEAQYGVQVMKVRMITMPSKSIRVGKRIGIRPGYKKAIVTLQKGHTLETHA